MKSKKFAPLESRCFSFSLSTLIRATGGLLICASLVFPYSPNPEFVRQPQERTYLMPFTNDAHNIQTLEWNGPKTSWNWNRQVFVFVGDSIIEISAEWTDSTVTINGSKFPDSAKGCIALEIHY